MEAGRLDRLVTLQSLVITRDSDFGGEVKTWSTFAQVWAQVDNTGGREAQSAQQQVATRTVKLTIRWLSGVTETMRAVFEGRTLEIKTVAEIGRRKSLVLMCEEINGD